MNRKRIISMLLVVILLLNAIIPVVNVNAASNNVFEFNQKLYKAIKTSLAEQNIAFSADDTTRTIEISDSYLAKVTELNLNECDLSDITGIESFKYLTHLDLSGNNLTEDSNLDVLNSLTSLNYLDLSSNNLLDVSAIEESISKIQNENGTVVISNQVATVVYDAIVDVEDGSDNVVTAKYELPKILEKAGLIKSAWRSAVYTYEDGQTVTGEGFIKSMSNPVTETSNFIEVKISSEDGYDSGIAKLEIYIYDDATEAASASNINPAANNMLVGSRFTIYITVHNSDSEAIYMPDSNLYKAVKEQLTGGQEVNPNLPTYKYETNSDSTNYVGEYFYLADTEDKNILYLFDRKVVESLIDSETTESDESPKVVDLLTENMYLSEYVLNLKTKEIYYKYSDTSSSSTGTSDTYGEVDGTKTWYHTGTEQSFEAYLVTDDYEKTTISLTDDTSGSITQYEGYKFLPINVESFYNLYEAAYDEPQVLIVPYEYLYSTIDSLILNNREIRDLTGIEKFVGLSYEVNVSHNYLSNISPIYELKANKVIHEAKLQEKYNYYLSTSPYGNLTESLSTTKAARTKAESEIENVKSARAKVIALFKEALEIKESTTKEVQKTVTNEDGTTSTETTTEVTTNENYDSEIQAKADEIDAITKEVYGYDSTDGTHVYGYLENLTSNLNKTYTNLKDVYNYLSLLYKVYNDEYKLATILTSELNYQTLEEYEIYKDTLNTTTANVKSLYTNEISKLINMQENQALSQFEEDALYEVLGTDSLSAYLVQVEKSTDSRTVWVEKLEEIREVALYSEMINYSLIKRMETNEENYSSFAEEYLKNRINEFTLEGIDTSLEESVLEKINNSSSVTDDAILELYKNYIYKTYAYNDLSNLVYGETYLDLETIAEELGVSEDNANLIAVYNDLENTRIIDTIEIQESICDDLYQVNNLGLYKEAIALASKFVVNSSEVSRYIKLSDLKKLDISYNAYLEDVNRITELSDLKELYASSDYLSDVSDIDWSQMKSLRKLDLSYNFLASIKPLEALENIKYLNVSNNLLSGSLDFDINSVKETLEDLDLSGNQLEDITTIMNYLDIVSGGDDGNYLAREDTININLNNQTINITVEEPIDLLVNTHTVDIDLPKIFTQLKAIDVKRTTYGVESISGRIESEGKYVTLLTDTVGDKEGIVKVQTISGQDTCVGDGTTATIKYTVVKKIEVIKAVDIKTEDSTEDVRAGDTLTFTADVTGEYVKDTSVTWSVEGNASEKTSISEDGVLIIGEDETAEKVTVIATSNADSTVVDKYEVLITAVTGVEVKTDAQKAMAGDTITFTADVTGKNLKDTSVTWSVEGNTSENTSISEDGTLTLGEDETAEKIIVIATSNADSAVSDKYELLLTYVTGVEVTTEAQEAKAGDTLTFTANVTGKNLKDTSVTWSVEGNTSENTSISQDGVLTVGSDETAEKVTVIATSNEDSTVVDKYEVLLTSVTSVEITAEAQEVDAGDTMTFTANVTGKNLKDTSVTWSVEGNTSEKTSISEDGILTVGEDETAEEIIVVATSNYDTSKQDKVTITVKSKVLVIEDDELGYEQEDKYLVKIAPKTPIEDFKTILLNGKEYKVVVKENDEETESKYMKTGMTVELSDDNDKTATYTVIVTGDINGDGYANSLDSILIKSHRLEVSQLKDEKFLAADINEDGKVNAADSKLLLYHRAEVKGYDLNFSK